MNNQPSLSLHTKADVKESFSQSQPNSPQRPRTLWRYLNEPIRVDLYLELQLLLLAFGYLLCHPRCFSR
jgi:hypothetical protein